MASDIVAFLTARLDEREQMAKAASGEHWEFDKDEAEVTSHGDRVAAYADVDWTDKATRISPADAALIARHDPAWVLADVAAKREIVRRHGSFAAHYRPGVACQKCWPLSCDLYLLALPDADHPDYRERWRQ